MHVILYGPSALSKDNLQALSHILDLTTVTVRQNHKYTLKSLKKKQQ